MSELASLMESATELQLIDVRPKAHFDKSRIRGAVHVLLNEVAEKATEFDPSKKTVVYCVAGISRLAAARDLKEVGFQDVTSLRGGFMAWSGMVRESE